VIHRRRYISVADTSSMNTFAGERGSRRRIPDSFPRARRRQAAAASTALAGGEQLVDGIRRQVRFG
jgi:hypothetical protein